MAPSVFISYSQDSDEHRARVLALADRLRADGIDATLDRYVMHPSQGWPKWAQQQIAEADFTLLVCTPSYRRRFEGDDPLGSDNAAAWEAWIVEQQLYEAGATNHGMIPVLFAPSTRADIPRVLRPFTSYELPDAYDDLCRHLTSQPATPPPPIGPPRPLTPDLRSPLHERSDAAAPAPHRFPWSWVIATTLGLAAIVTAGWLWPTPRPTRTPIEARPTARTSPDVPPRSPTRSEAASWGANSSGPNLSGATPTEPHDDGPHRATTTTSSTTASADDPHPGQPVRKTADKRPAPPPEPTPTASPTRVDSRRWEATAVVEDPARFSGQRLQLNGPRVAPGTILTLATRCDPPTTSTAGPRCRVLSTSTGLACQLTRDSTIPAGSSLCVHPQGTRPDPR